jgi:hypothetical protein
MFARLETGFLQRSLDPGFPFPVAASKVDHFLFTNAAMNSDGELRYPYKLYPLGLIKVDTGYVQVHTAIGMLAVKSVVGMVCSSNAVCNL